MKKRTILFALFLPLLAAGQGENDTPELFIARFKNVVESDVGSRFLPELVLSKTEFREWWKDNCGNHFDYENPGPEMDKKLDQIVEDTWPSFSYEMARDGREGGYGDFWKKFEVDSIKTDASAEAIGGALGHVPFVKEMVISVFGHFPEQPEAVYEIRFPVAKIRDGKWKLWSQIVQRKKGDY